MFNSRVKNFIITCIVLLLLNILMLSLCIWQVYRGQYKQNILDIINIEKNKTDNLVNIYSIIDKKANKKNKQDLLYKNTKLEGKFTQPTIFLSRRHDDNISGYWVINPLILSNNNGENIKNNTVLVAHDFIVDNPTNKNKQNLYTADNLSNNYNININFNQIYNINLAYFIEQIPRVLVLGNNIIDKDKDNQNIIMQNLSSEIYRNISHKEISDFMLALPKNILGKNLPNLYVQNLTPQRHYAYALTWFGLWLVSTYFIYQFYKNISSLKLHKLNNLRK